MYYEMFPIGSLIVSHKGKTCVSSSETRPYTNSSDFFLHIVMLLIRDRVLSS